MAPNRTGTKMVMEPVTQMNHITIEMKMVPGKKDKFILSSHMKMRMEMDNSTLLNHLQTRMAMEFTILANPMSIPMVITSTMIQNHLVI